MARIFLDHYELRKGYSYHHSGALTATEGHRYEVEEWIGRGGNAAVFSCRELSTGDEYAVKFPLHPRALRDGRFLREVELMQQLSHAHIVKYRGTGVAKMRDPRSQVVEIPFLVMDLATSSLDAEMRKRRSPWGYELYAGQFRGLAQALSILHKVAIHRDIKPENILIAGDRWMLSDYGLCTYVNPDDDDDLTGKSENVGPKYWLSPEAHSRRLGCGDNINEASDVYQLAAVFWYVATGRHPSGILTNTDWRGPQPLFDLLHRCLHHNTQNRPKCGKEMLEALERVLSA